MSFDLRVYFTGLCLFAPDTAPANPAQHRMHVVLPSFGTGEHLHRARLVYDVAYLTGAPNLARRLDCVALEGTYLELLLKGALKPELPREIVSLDPLVEGEKLHRIYIGETPGPLVSSRFTFSTGAVSDYAVGAHFTLGAASARRMTWQVEWTIRGIDAASLAMDFKRFATGLEEDIVPQPPTELFPIGETIRLFVYNATCEDLPPRHSQTADFPGNVEAKHFEAYYRLYGHATEKPVPVVFGTEFNPEDVDCGCAPPSSGGVEEVHGAISASALDPRHILSGGVRPRARREQNDPPMGGRPFTCMVAQATLAPGA